MVTDSEKIKTFRKQKKLTQTALAFQLGIKQQQIAMIENGSRPASSGFKLAFMKVYGIDWDSQTTSGETFTYEHLIEENNQTIIPIPFYNVAAAAGEGEIIPDYSEKNVIYFDTRWLQNILGVNPKNIVIIQAKGDSMDGGNYPIKDNDLLMVDTSIKEIINNKVFVIQQDNELRVKRLVKEFNGDIYLISDNSKEYPPESVKTELKIIGKVVWNGSKETV